MWHEETLASMQSVLRGEDMPAVGYDSDDDPEVLVNKRIKVRYSYSFSGLFSREVCPGSKYPTRFCRMS